MAKSARTGSSTGNGTGSSTGRSGGSGTGKGGGATHNRGNTAVRDRRDRAGSGRDARNGRAGGAEDLAPAPAVPAVPLWMQLVTFVLALGGLGVSIYETYAHFNGSHLLGCTGTGAEDCTKVITSPQSMVFGVIPVAILGLVFYVFVAAIMSPWAWRITRREVAWARLGAMTVGVGFVIYLVYAELFQIGSICLYCTSVHIITFLLFALTVVAVALWGTGTAGKRPA